VRAPALALAALATVLAASACGSSGGGLISPDTAGSLNTDLTNIQAGVAAQDCAVTNAAIEAARNDFENLPSSIDSKLANQLREGFTTLVTSAELQCQSSSGNGSTGQTGTSGSTSTSSSTSSSSTSSSTSTSSTTTSSTATTTTNSSAATTSTTGTGSSCIPVTNPNGGTVCEGTTGSTSTNGIGGGGGVGPGN